MRWTCHYVGVRSCSPSNAWPPPSKLAVCSLDGYRHGVIERLSDQARVAVDAADGEARRMGQHRIGSERLLRGIMCAVGCKEGRVLRASGAARDAAREKVDEAVGTKLDSHAGEPTYT